MLVQYYNGIYSDEEHNLIKIEIISIYEQIIDIIKNSRYNSIILLDSNNPDFINFLSIKNNFIKLPDINYILSKLNFVENIRNLDYQNDENVIKVLKK